MRSTLLFLMSLLGITAPAPAQPAHTNEAAGTSTVSGRVFCGDTNAPARMATVSLQPADAVDAFNPEKGESMATQAEAVQTLLDGSFVFPHVTSGAYYVIAALPGYVSPLSALMKPEEDSALPREPNSKRIAKLVPRVTVQANLPAVVNISLERGAAVSGTIQYDDGSPASGLSVGLLVRWKDQWIPLPSTPFERLNPYAMTDDQGAYRISGMPAKEYMVQVTLNLSKSTFHSDGHGSGQSSSTVFSLPVYSGNKTRTKDAEHFTLKAGEERRGEDIQIPVSKLHTVRGNIIAKHDGHVINRGFVTLLNADDKSQAGYTEVAREDESFQFGFVPEGDYILRIGYAADTEWFETPNPPHMSPPTRTDYRTLRTYGSADLLLHVEGDLSGVTVTVPELPGQPVQPNQ